MTIVDFLHARINEDEQVAREAMNVPDGVQRTASVAQSPHDPWQGWNSDETKMLVHAPAADVPDAALDAIGDWGLSSGPIKLTAEDRALFAKIDLPAEDEPDRPYTIGDSGLWDESEPIGAEFYRATIPARAGRGTAHHITRHDPARVLAECKAKRRIIDLHPIEPVYIHNQALCSNPDEDEPIQAGWNIPLELRILATVYRDHPDFQRGWGIS